MTENDVELPRLRLGDILGSFKKSQPIVLSSNCTGMSPYLAMPLIAFGLSAAQAKILPDALVTVRGHRLT